MFSAKAVKPETYACTTAKDTIYDMMDVFLDSTKVTGTRWFIEFAIRLQVSPKIERAKTKLSQVIMKKNEFRMNF